MRHEMSTPSGNWIEETARQTPVVERCDVLVAGGGPAGVAAALAAARAGADVRLIECHGQLGGVWTSGMLSWILDSQDKVGMMRELLDRLEARGARAPLVQGGVAYDVEEMKLMLETLCLEAGVKVRLHTRVVAAPRDRERRVAVAITESKSGREAFAAPVFVDATGDGDLAALAGCGFDLGRPADDLDGTPGETQPMSMLCLIAGIDLEATAAFHERDGRPWLDSKQALLSEFKRAGVVPSYGLPTILEIRPDLYAWMINHEYGVSGLNAQEISDATIRARAENHQLINALRNLSGIWSGIRIVGTPAQIGVREGRRVHGRAMVTVDDMVSGRRHEDAVCSVRFPIDVHSTNKGTGTGIESSGKQRHRTQPYDIPYLALVAADVDNLLLAGRCISGDFLAHSSYRVTGNAVAMGEAAGAAAAFAAQHKVQPAALNYVADVKPLLRAGPVRSGEAAHA